MLLFKGTVHPIGSAPDGIAWTGFASVSQEGGGYLLIFRELNQNAVWQTGLSLFGPGEHRIEVLGGKGSATLAGGILRAEIPALLDFVFLRVSVDDVPVDGPATVEMMLAARKPGDPVEISVRNENGEIYTAVLNLWERVSPVLRRSDRASLSAVNAWRNLTHGASTTFAN